MNISLPAEGEYRDYQLDYIQRVPEGSDVMALLKAQVERLSALVQSVTDQQASTPHKAGEWTIKQVLGHLSDTERVLSYRALCVARGDQNNFPGFEQDDYAAVAGSNTRTVADLLDEFAAVRGATLALYRSLSPDTYNTIGSVNGQPASVRAILRIIPGHVENHLAGLKADYRL